MSTFILVHGAWHGAWCWYKVIPLLEAHGHTVIAEDLPGLGVDRRPPSESTLDAFVAQTVAAIDRATEPVVLVGHSMGGAVVTQAAEDRAERLAAAVFLTAFQLPDGASIGDLGQTADLSRIGAAQEHVDGLLQIRPDALGDLFYHDCSAADLALARRALVPMSAAPFGAAVQTTPDRFPRVRRVYIACTEDRALPLAFQRRLAEAVPGVEEITMATSHSPFFSQPEALAAHLHTIATG